MHNQQVISIAREWLGTPYMHQASLKGVGVDCIGLVIGIWRELYGGEPEDFKLPPYSPRWAEETGDELMVTIARKYLEEIPLGEQIPGDVLMYRMFRRGMTKHAAIMISADTIIHAYNRHDVMESAFISNVGSAITHAFRFPVAPSNLRMLTE